MKSDLVFRVIPCLDIKDGRVVKGTNFKDLRDVNSSVELAKKYNDEGADELILLDITASYEGRGATINIVKEVAEEVFIPFTVGGGVNTLDDIYELLNVGCDKISINSSAVKNPSFIDESVKYFGSQCVVVAIDVKRVTSNNRWNVFINGGRVDTGIDYISWVKEVSDRGAGEILLTSMDQDGVRKGYDIDLLSASSSCVNIPLIISGGAGSMDDIKDAYFCGADAALAASIFHYGEIHIPTLKTYLRNNHIPVRI